ncbi:MAG: DegT/DnrJ/EryC1/StrS family aminotransferase [Burkholderiales bacterium]
MNHIQMLDLKLEYDYMKDNIDIAINKCLEHQKWILGPEVKEFEEKIASYIGVKHCIGTASGTDALVLSLRALAIKTKGKEYFDREDLIITTPFTFTATGDAILRAGATPLFVDINLKTYNVDTNKIKEALKEYKGKVIGIIPVHLYGNPCNMDEIVSIAKENNIFIVEDCAQSFGATWGNKQTGSFDDTGCFSFFPSKNLGAFGDAGTVVTDDDERAEIVRMLIKHGGKDKYNVEYIGYNSRLDTLQAAILLAKLGYLDEFNEKRRKIAKIYNENLKNIDWIELPEEQDNGYHVYHQYTVRLKEAKGERDALQKHLHEKGIQTMVYYPLPLHRMKVFNRKCVVYGSLKNSELSASSVLSLPVEPLMGNEKAQRIADSIGLFKF